MGNWKLGILGTITLGATLLTGCVNDAQGRPVQIDMTRPGEIRISDSMGGSIRLSAVSAMSALAAIGSQNALTQTVTTVPVPPISVPGTTTTPPAQAQTGGQWTRQQKCDWLKANFPQSTQTVQEFGAKATTPNVEPKRIRASSYPCDAAGNGVFDGFIVLGPNEGFGGEVTMTVTPGGAIDAYDVKCGARYSATPRKVAGGKPNPCDDTWRADSGTVTGQSMTYWPWNDEHPPLGLTAQGAPGPAGAAPGQVPAATGTATASPATSPTPTVSPTATIADAGKGVAAPGQTPDKAVCKLGKDLATEKKWTLLPNQDASVTKYGGAQVRLDKADTLPLGWEALTSGPKITADQSDRTMVPGPYSVYPPNDGTCRQQLGVSN